jgi:hypothetical protein
MKQPTRSPATSRFQVALAFGLRGLRGLLILACWTLNLVSLCAGQLADLAGRSAESIRVR